MRYRSYTGINANLILDTAITQISSTIPNTGYTPVSCSMAGQASSPLDDTITFSVTNPGTRMSTSTGQNDSGLFDVNLKDERWLPFEGFENLCHDHGIRSQGQRHRLLDRYRCRHHSPLHRPPGIDEPTVRTALTTTPNLDRSILVSVRHTFGYRLLQLPQPSGHDANPAASHTPLHQRYFPLFQFGHPDNLRHPVLCHPHEATAGAAITGATFAQQGTRLHPRRIRRRPNAEIPVLSGAGPTRLPSPSDRSLSALPAVNGQLQLPSASVNDIILIINYSIIPA